MQATSAATWPNPNVHGFEIVRRIGGGGESAVFEAHRRGSAIALKIVDLRPKGAALRFHREATIGSIFSHPAVLSTFEAGSCGHLGWMAMPLLEGASLAEAQREGCFTFQQRLTVLEEIGHGLAHIHEHGVIHCDLKPTNVLLTNDRHPRILDFGAVVFAAERGDADDCGHGTHSYLAPERIRGERIDHRSDLFSLGVLAFELFTGSHPWRANSAAALLYAMCTKPPRSFRDAALASPIPMPSGALEHLAEAVDRALRPEPRLRFESASAFVRTCAESRC